MGWSIKSGPHPARLLIVPPAHPKEPPLGSLSDFTATITEDGCINLYSLPPSEAIRTLINLSTCYCQVEHIHLVSPSVYSSISLRFLPFRPYFVTFKETHSCLPLSCYAFNSWSWISPFILAVKPPGMRSHFPIHKMSTLRMLVTCAVRCHRRLNRSPRESSNYTHIYLRKLKKRVLQVGKWDVKCLIGFCDLMAGVRSWCSLGTETDRPFMVCKRLKFALFILKMRKVTSWHGVTQIFKIRF